MCVCRMDTGNYGGNVNSVCVIVFMLLRRVAFALFMALIWTEWARDIGNMQAGNQLLLEVRN
jgi:hypothetical protein